MTNRCDSMILWCTLFQILIVIDGCERSLEVRGVEDYCWTKKVNVKERLEYTGKSVLNFAKRKLGMEVEADDEPQKCDYYECIFQELKMLNGNAYPCHEGMTKWVKNNVIYNHAAVLLSQIDKCSDGLSNSTITGTYFFGDKVGETFLVEEDKVLSNEPQSKCDIAAEYMKCLSIADRNETCPIFQYP